MVRVGSSSYVVYLLGASWLKGKLECETWLVGVELHFSRANTKINLIIIKPILNFLWSKESKLGAWYFLEKSFFFNSCVNCGSVFGLDDFSTKKLKLLNYIFKTHKLKYKIIISNLLSTNSSSDSEASPVKIIPWVDFEMVFTAFRLCSYTNK